MELFQQQNRKLDTISDSMNGHGNVIETCCVSKRKERIYEVISQFSIIAWQTFRQKLNIERKVYY